MARQGKGSECASDGDEMDLLWDVTPPFSDNDENSLVMEDRRPSNGMESDTGSGRGEEREESSSPPSLRALEDDLLNLTMLDAEQLGIDGNGLIVSGLYAESKTPGQEGRYPGSSDNRRENPGCGSESRGEQEREPRSSCTSAAATESEQDREDPQGAREANEDPERRDQENVIEGTDQPDNEELQDPATGQVSESEERRSSEALELVELLNEFDPIRTMETTNDIDIESQIMAATAQELQLIFAVLLPFARRKLTWTQGT